MTKPSQAAWTLHHSTLHSLSLTTPTKVLPPFSLLYCHKKVYLCIILLYTCIHEWQQTTVNISIVCVAWLTLGDLAMSSTNLILFFLNCTLRAVNRTASLLHSGCLLTWVTCLPDLTSSYTTMRLGLTVWECRSYKSEVNWVAVNCLTCAGVWVYTSVVSTSKCKQGKLCLSGNSLNIHALTQPSV